MYSTMSVRRDPAWAASHGFHPDSYLVWDTSLSGEPYVVFVCQRMGRPLEPNQEMLSAIRAMDAARVHGGRRAWAGEAANATRDMDLAAAAKRERSFRERFDYDFAPRAMRFAGHGRVFPAAKV